MQTRAKTPLEELCAGVMPHIAARIKRAYWIGAAEGAEAAQKRPPGRKLKKAS